MCEKRYVVVGVGSIGYVVGDGAMVGLGVAVQVLLMCPIPCPPADSDFISLSVVVVCCWCVNLSLCMCVFGAFCLHGWVWWLYNVLLLVALAIGWRGT